MNSNMDKAECASYLTNLFNEHGMQALTTSWLGKNGHLNVYKRFSAEGGSVQQLATTLGILDEFLVFRKAQADKNRYRIWTEEALDEQAHKLVAAHGRIPTAEWLSANQLSGFHAAVTTRYKTLEAFSKRFYDRGATRQTSRDGQTWDSFAEACLANFLWSRNIAVYKGRRYPKEYEEQSGRAFGTYDLEFVGLEGDFKAQRILVEVWGDLPNGKRKDGYAETRQFKESFNVDNPNFVGLQYTDCYEEQKLIDKLFVYIGDLKPCRFVGEHDTHFPPTQWTLADEVVQKAKFIISKIDGGILPTSNWFKRNRSYLDRPVLEWEPVTWGAFPDKIRMIGGFRRLRDILGQSEANKSVWTREKVLDAMIATFNDHGTWPGKLRYDLKQKPNLTAIQRVLLFKLQNISSVVPTHFGSMENAIKTATLMLPADKRSVLVQRELPTGVRLQRNRYRADIRVNGKKKCLGIYDTVEAARAARLHAEAERDRARFGE